MSDRFDEQEDQIDTDPLFYGLTVPATLDGSVPVYCIPAFIAMAAIPTLITFNPVWLLVVIPLYMIAYTLCKDDPHFFKRCWLYLRTKARTSNKFYWGGSSYSPTGRFRRRGRRTLYDEV